MNIEDIILEAVAVHDVGDKNMGEPLRLSESLLKPDSEEDILLRDFFLTHFKGQEYFNFRMVTEEIHHSRLLQIAKDIFEDPERLLAESCQIARILYGLTESDLLSHRHLYVCYFRDVMIADEVTDAIGIYFCNMDDQFLTPRNIQTSPQVEFTMGTYLGKHEMACLIYDTDEENGYKVDVIDRSKKSPDGQLWKDLFLKVKPAEDDFFHTRHVMGLAKSFVENQLPVEFEVEKKDQFEYLNRSIDYFKNNDHYSEKEFADQIFENGEMTESFGNYRDAYQDQHEVVLESEFDVDENAVKKQARHFKSILKLDKNFHIYIHGDRSKIERGADEDGRKYYKVYYEKEM